MTEALRDQVVEVLKTIYDPEIPVNIHEIGLIYEVNVDDDANVHVLMTLTSPMCPVAESLPPEVEEKVAGVGGHLGPALGPGDDVRGRQARAGVLLATLIRQCQPLTAGACSPLHGQ
jgi:hypothetical protein